MDAPNVVIEVTKIVSPLLAVAIAAVLTYWIKGRETRRDVARLEADRLRLWFERYALVEGIDPILAELLYVKQLLTASGMSDASRATITDNLQPIPVEAHVRLAALLGTQSLFTVSVASRAATRTSPPEGDRRQMLEAVDEATAMLSRLRQLIVVSRISSESDAQRIPGDIQVARLAANLTKSIADGFSLPADDDKVERYQYVIQRLATDHSVVPLDLAPVPAKRRLRT